MTKPGIVGSSASEDSKLSMGSMHWRPFLKTTRPGRCPPPLVVCAMRSLVKLTIPSPCKVSESKRNGSNGRGSGTRRGNRTSRKSRLQGRKDSRMQFRILAAHFGKLLLQDTISVHPMSPDSRGPSSASLATTDVTSLHPCPGAAGTAATAASAAFSAAASRGSSVRCATLRLNASLHAGPKVRAGPVGLGVAASATRVPKRRLFATS
mmetsp:Transcript_127304/g.354411  ORF Transcript_127304/g.354411 Transcript_127304/m.354411 type:complete len:208 (+) Transcript_127304:336-959(+)